MECPVAKFSTVSGLGYLLHKATLQSTFENLGLGDVCARPDAVGTHGGGIPHHRRTARATSAPHQMATALSLRAHHRGGEGATHGRGGNAVVLSAKSGARGQEAHRMVACVPEMSCFCPPACMSATARALATSMPCGTTPSPAIDILAGSRPGGFAPVVRDARPASASTTTHNQCAHVQARPAAVDSDVLPVGTLPSLDPARTHPSCPSVVGTCRVQGGVV